MLDMTTYVTLRPHSFRKLVDVEVEPQLQPVTTETLPGRSANTSADARLVIRARGFWRRGQNSFFDVRVTNPDCASQVNSSIPCILKKHEEEKKRQYNERVMQIEQGTFTPLVFTTTGSMGPECLQRNSPTSLENGYSFD